MAYCKDFAWGCATSAYQIEGGYDADGKGLNIWDVFCKEKGNVDNGDTGEIACDHYHRIKEDVKLMSDLGIKAYRFSINWSRVLPEGKGRVNEAGIKFYDDLINELLANKIKPYITLYHWDLPYELHKLGGWENPEIVEWFGEYAALISERYSDRVTHYFTLNEPQVFIGLGYITGEHAPGLKKNGKDTFIMYHNALKAHGRAVQRLREKAKQPIEVGIAPTGSMCYPASNRKEDIEAARMALFELPTDPNAWTWNVSVWSDPVFFGKYSDEFLKNFESYMPAFTDADMKLISEPTDIYGQNIYNGHEIRMGKDGHPEIIERPKDFPITGNGWPITPKCLYWGPYFLYERYKKPLFITENGLCTKDILSSDGKDHDELRVNFLNQYLNELEKVTNDIDLRGYFLWSLMDNFEWNKGYTDRFGIIHVDFETQVRTPKDSYYWYQEYIKNHS